MEEGLIVLLLKKGDPTNIDNYRGISLLNLPGKVFAIVLKHKIQNWADGLLLEGQCGFRKGRSCNDAIFSLNGLAELTHKTGNELHACFVDLNKAYDSVDRLLAWELISTKDATAHQGPAYQHHMCDASKQRQARQLVPGFQNREQLQAIIASVYQALQDWGMQMSIPKTKYLCYTRTQNCVNGTA